MTHDGKATLQKMKKVSDWEAAENVDTISSTDPKADDADAADSDADDDDKASDSNGFFDGEEEPEWSRMCIDLKKKCSTVVWHHKGDYFATVSSQATHSAVLIHRLSRRQSQSPFKKSKGLVQTVMFHPTKPFFFVASKRNIRVYNLTKQKLIKKLNAPAKWISSMVIHPTGDHVLCGSYDRRLSWFDLDLSSAPYKTLKYHKKAIRSVAFHRSYPLFASAADDGNLHIFHGKVYNDLLTNPLIVPVKILKAHKPIGDLGTLSTVFHPTQPWIFSAGADKAIRLFTY
jgi:ribosome biogenesis protein ERB1